MKKILLLLLFLTFLLTNVTKIKAQSDTISKYKPLLILGGVDRGSYYTLAKDIKKLVDRNIKKIERKIEDFDDQIEDLSDLLTDNPGDTAKIKKLEKRVLKLEEDKDKLDRIRVDVETSKGSDENFELLVKRTKVDIAFLQYDVLLSRQLKDLDMNTYYTDDIRLLLPVGLEQIHLITSVNSGINSIQDLKGKKVATGNPKSGTAITCEVIKRKTGLKWTDVPLPSELSFNSVVNEKIDAMFFVGSAPVSKFELPAASRERIRLVPVFDVTLNKERTYSSAIIKGDTYKWADYDVDTYAIRSILAVNISSESDEKHERIMQLLEFVCNNLPYLRKNGHPAWKDIDFNTKSIDLPTYDGAETIFEEYKDKLKDDANDDNDND